MATANKVLKLSNRKGKVDFSLIKDGKEIPLRNKHLRLIIENFLKDIRFAYLQLPKYLHIEPVKGEYFSVKTQNSEGKLVNVSTDNISNLISKLIPRENFKLDINGEEIEFKYKRDSVAVSVNYLVAKDIVNNLKKGKTIAIKNLQYVSRIKVTKTNPYDKAFKSVVKDFSIKEDGKKAIATIIFYPFKDLLIKVEVELKLNKRKFSEINSYYNILKRIKDHTYLVKYIGIGYKQREGAFLVISYEFETQDKKPSGKAMGVDLGQAHLVYYAIPGTESRGDVSVSYQWEDKIKGIWNKKKALQRALMQIKDLKKEENSEDLEKGYKKVVKELKAIRDYEKNFMETLNKQVTASLVKIALKEGVSKIVLEELSLSPEEKNALKFPKWNYYQLQTMIENKAKENGIQVEKINPAYTSQRCPKCEFVAFIKDMVRPKRDTFICPRCGFKADADYTAALNIATKDIEERIKSYIIHDIEILEDRKLRSSEKKYNIQRLQRWRISLLKQLLIDYLQVKNSKTSLKKLLNKLASQDRQAYNLLIEDLQKFKGYLTKE